MGSVAGTLILAAFAVSVYAAPNTLNWGTEVNPGMCDKVGKPVVNVNQKVINDADSGLGGYWAFDNYTRHIQLWSSSAEGEYCAEVSYTGQFDAQAGKTSPGEGGLFDGDEDGTMQGGYRATITGDLLAEPTWKTRGNVGSFDYDCNLTGVCGPERVDWVAQYFNGVYDFEFDWWGWIYHAGNHGTWVNSVDGNAGDIL
ncbi:MAG: hypothetical protein COU25_01390 [Candidatus Levybacteria bacterium CG10_big_fil_rev_8_21_14_0_10_35_13]|nr:MAG: hypothetical protein COU25_01390 [Candidatus Levybacteria bacterium CG10_big_fil_rev_8_21_14_0_10_35_13]